MERDCQWPTKEEESDWEKEKTEEPSIFNRSHKCDQELKRTQKKCNPYGKRVINLSQFLSVETFSSPF